MSKWSDGLWVWRKKDVFTLWLLAPVGFQDPDSKTISQTGCQWWGPHSTWKQQHTVKEEKGWEVKRGEDKIKKRREEKRTSGSQSPSAVVSSPPPAPQCWPVSVGSGVSEPAAGTSTDEKRMNQSDLITAFWFVKVTKVCFYYNKILNPKETLELTSPSLMCTSLCLPFSITFRHMSPFSW